MVARTAFAFTATNVSPFVAYSIVKMVVFTTNRVCVLHTNRILYEYMPIDTQHIFLA